MRDALQVALLLLATAVVVVVVCRLLRLPALLGYLLVGILIGPHALGWVPDSENTRYLAEFGVVFLMFSIGLEFSLPKLVTMRRVVFGLGAPQVTAVTLLVLAWPCSLGLDWQAGWSLGGALAMSSTAILGKMLAERLELNSLHGRQIIGVLLFQDLAVVPFLILIPALAAGTGQLAREPRDGARQGRGGARPDAVSRPARDAPVVSPGGAAEVLRAVHAQRAAVHARARLAHAPARTCRSRWARSWPAC